MNRLYWKYISTLCFLSIIPFSHAQTIYCGSRLHEPKTLCATRCFVSGGPQVIAFDAYYGDMSGQFRSMVCPNHCTATDFVQAGGQCSAPSIAPSSISFLKEVAKTRVLLAVGCSGGLVPWTPRSNPDITFDIYASKKDMNDLVLELGD